MTCLQTVLIVLISPTRWRCDFYMDVVGAGLRCGNSTWKQLPLVSCDVKQIVIATQLEAISFPKSNKETRNFVSFYIKKYCCFHYDIVANLVIHTETKEKLVARLQVIKLYDYWKPLIACPMLYFTSDSCSREL